MDRHPARAAITFQDTTLTYLELDRLANGLAGQLRDAGVRLGDLVPVLLGDVLELPLAYLALMKLGATFVPLNPDWPATRIRSTVDIAGGRLVVGGDPAMRGSVPWTTFPVDAGRLDGHDHRPGTVVTGADHIYGFFTSGTTGTPKCALNRHAGLTNRFLFMNRYFHATGDEVVLQNSRHTYDSSVWQLFWPLTTGGRTVIPTRGHFLDIADTIGLIARHRVTITDFVPSVLGAMVSIVDSKPDQVEHLSSLRHLVVGGEEINPRMTHRLRELLPGIRITNGYGPTEASIGMVFHPVTDADGDTIPLGRPIDNCYATVVDDGMRPVPAGQPGELVIGGTCLGDGYLGQPARTAEAFVANPFPLIPGQRLYRTGDLARFDEHGVLFFLGRRDGQVQVGGVRVELGEIETVAARCPGVQHATAITVDTGDTRSVALFVAGPAALTQAAVRAYLAAALPRNHLPRHIRVIEAMPLTGNGKVDRAALAALLAPGPVTPVPAGPTAQDTLLDRVLRAFREALEQPDLDPVDSFPDAGGDSLQAVAVVSVLSREAGVPIGVQDLVEHPSAADMAKLIEHRRAVFHDAPDLATLWARDAATVAAMAVRPAPAHDPEHVVVTGATGFVGAYLVHTLLATPGLRVSCVVRGADDADARGRMVGALREQGLWRPGYDDRLAVHAGDLTRPGLGLSAAVWDHLAVDSDVVLHNGAMVNFLFDYQAHRGPNVLGTVEVLRLAMARRAKPLHHVSTLGVLDGQAARQVRGGGARFPESVTAGSQPPPATGYSQSKWLAERVLHDAARRGATITVYRLGEIMPGDNGRPNPKALTHLLLTAFHRLGASPDVPIWSDYTPVDYTAARVVAGLLDPSVRGQTLHVFHPSSVCFAVVLDDDGGRPLDRIGPRAFLARLTEAAHDTADPELRTLLGLVQPASTLDGAAAREYFATLLADNPRLFRKDRCRQLERRWQLDDPHLAHPMAAYRDHLGRA